MDKLMEVEQEALPFRSPKRYFADIDPTLAAHMVSSGVDVAFVLDGGTIKDLALGNADLVEAGCDAAWRGKAWRKIVTPESVQKVEELLQAPSVRPSRWRQVTQVTATGEHIPIRFTTVRTGKDDRVLALGQDLRSIGHLQQRLVAMHQDLEREYASLRDSEARYRSLFDSLSEAVIIVGVHDGLVSEMNPAAAQRLGAAESDPNGRPFADFIAASDRAAVQRMIDRAVSSGRGEAADIRFPRRGTGTLRATAFRQDNDVFAIVRIDGDGAPAATAVPNVDQADIRQVLEHLPDGLVVTTSTLRILSANATFLTLIRAVEDRQVMGDQLSNWMGRSSTELNMLEANLKRHGVVRNFSTTLRDRFGVEDPVEVAGVAAELDGETVFGFAIRPMSRRLTPRESPDEWLPGRAEQVTSLVGQMPLKDIVKASTDLIEKLCIETALEISDHSRASAAEILGLSRQGLYSKLKRFQIPDQD